MCSNSQVATIIPVVAVGSTKPPFFVEVYISQKLCSKTCATKTPVFKPSFKVKDVKEVGEMQYMATIHVDGIISYQPCGGGCCSITQNISQDFTLPIFSDGEPSLKLLVEEPYNRMEVTDCQKCSRTFKSDVPIAVDVEVAPAAKKKEK